MNTITIVGAGLTGALAAIYLAKQGYKVELFESRDDIRLHTVDAGRSINLAMSCRGLTGLEGVGLTKVVQKIMVPMRARAIHEVDKPVKYQPFGRNPDEYINAIQRTDLNKLLLDEAAQLNAVTIYFNHELIALDLTNKILTFKDAYHHKTSIKYQRLIGADGAHSRVREFLINKNVVTANRIFEPHGYKELSISRDYPKQLAREHLHLWPRNAFMLLGNPNVDASITGTLFLAKQGKNSFAELTDELTVQKFFKEFFPDVLQAMPDIAEEFYHNPVGNMSTIHCAPWYCQDQCLLIGDAAHGVVPFFGQGMNSGFEDCRVLDALINQTNHDWQKIIPLFYQQRKPNTDAVAQMSLDNYHEIQIDIREPKFNLKKQAEQALMHRYPDVYISKHVLVMFTNTPYATAYNIGNIQAKLLNELIEDCNSVAEIDWHQADKLLSSYQKEVATLI